MPYYAVLHDESLSGSNYYTIKVSQNSDINKLKEYVTNTFEEFIPEAIFEVRVLEYDLNQSDFDYFKNMGSISFMFSFLAIIIAALGMFGLVSFTLKRKIKEIGIRKALGALSAQIFKLLLMSYLKLLAVAVVISIPIGFYLLTFNTSTYKPAIEIWEFLLSAFIAFFLVIITAGYHTFKASKASPIESLKYE